MHMHEDCIQIHTSASVSTEKLIVLYFVDCLRQKGAYVYMIVSYLPLHMLFLLTNIRICKYIRIQFLIAIRFKPSALHDIRKIFDLS